LYYTAFPSKVTNRVFRNQIMWRLANYIYHAFRTVATHRCPQDIIVPIATIFKKDYGTNRGIIDYNF